MVLAVAARAESPWDLKKLSRPPQVYPATSPQARNIQALYFEGLPWKGKPTRVFAWYGKPAGEGTGKFPAVVLVHGGHGTAFAEWVKEWNDRGYAAIAIDTCGSVPSRGFDEPSALEERPRHAYAGPACWDASFDQVNWPIKDQWTYHAVADIILANSLLRSLGEIDSQRIGITGISWGGYLTTIAASVDARFRFAIPVYGCGFRGDDPEWPLLIAKIGAANAQRWLDLWDPSIYLPQARMPFLWIDGSNDFFCTLSQLQKSYRLLRSPATLSIHMGMPHSQENGQAPREIPAFANQVVASGVALATIVSEGQSGHSVWVKFTSARPIARAELVYTLDTGSWQARRWSTISAQVDIARHTVQATTRSGTTDFFFNIVDDRGLVVSSPHQSSH